MTALGNGDYVIREMDITQDAEKLAEMWRASDDQWPGTWSGGTEITAEMVTEWTEREGNIYVSVVETADRDKIVGYCSFNEDFAQKGVGYVGLLNVQPDYQKKSLARRLLQQSIDRCIEFGFHMVTLGTWSGNLKSVPLYKKTGFHWVPDTSVWMLNFIPGILSLPCAQSYFSKHDWYKTMQRELSQVEDDMRWEGMKVFVYHFIEDGESLKVWADREANRITAVETDTFFAGAIASNIEPPKGMVTQIRWRIKNKQDRPMSVSLIASGTEHMKLDYRKSLQVQPGEEVELEADVNVALNTPDVKRHIAVPSLRTLMIIDGDVLELGTGLKPQSAIAVSTSPKHVSLVPGVEKAIHIQLRSYLQEDREVTVRLTPPEGLDGDWTESTLTIPAKSWGGVQLKLVAQSAGVYPLKALVSFEGGKTEPKPLPVFCMPVGGVLAYKGEKNTRIENSAVRLSLDTNGGGVGVHLAKDDTWLGTISESVGPPFWPSEYRSKDFDISLENQHGQIIATMDAASDDYPGLVLHRRITMGAGGLVEVKTDLVNYGSESYNLQINRSVYMGEGFASKITVPLVQGIVQAHKAEFPDAEEDISKKPEAFAERWISLSSDKGTLGVLWEESVVENEMGWSFSLLTPKLSNLPQTQETGGRLYIYAGPGDWHTVREYAQKLSGADQDIDEIPIQARQVQAAYFEPAPLVTVSDKPTTTLIVDNLRGKPLNGSLKIMVPESIKLVQDEFALDELTRDKTLREQVTLELPANAAAYTANMNLSTQLFDVQSQLPIVRLGSDKQVTVNIGESIVSLDNGLSQFEVAPAFTGALTAWYMDGHNHVLTPYPDVKTFGWMSPWYGGITPLATTGGGYEDDFPGKLYQESLSAKRVECTDTYGIPWIGVRLSTSIQREKLLGLDVTLDYLTVGDSNVLKLVYQVTNQTSASRYLDVGWATFWQPDGTSEHNILRGGGMERKPNPWYSWAQTGHSATLSNGETGRTVAMVSPYPEVKLMDWGDAGGHLGCYAGVRVPPSGTLQRTTYVAICDDLETAERYAALKDYLG